MLVAHGAARADGPVTFVDDPSILSRLDEKGYSLVILKRPKPKK